MKKIILTGASGFLGYHLCRELKDNYLIDALYYRQNFNLEGINWHKLNLFEEKEIIDFFKKTNADAVIHAAAIANPNFCEEHPAFSHHINVYASITIAEQCKKLGIPMLFISTDQVFNGSSGKYSEADFAYPLNKYGEQKLTAEEVLTDEFENNLVCRLPLLFGFGPEYSNNFFKDWIIKLKNSEEIIAFSDEFRSPLGASYAAKAIALALDYLLQNPVDRENLLHLGGPERISRYDFALLMSEVLKLPSEFILSSTRSEVPMPAARPQDVSFDSNLAGLVLGFNPHDLKVQMLYENSIK